MKPMPRTKQPKVGDPEYRHPYVRYEGTPMWRWVHKGITDLVGNLDLVEREEREYIVGYLCKVIANGQAQEQRKKTSR